MHRMCSLLKLYDAVWSSKHNNTLTAQLNTYLNSWPFPTTINMDKYWLHILGYNNAWSFVIVYIDSVLFKDKLFNFICNQLEDRNNITVQTEFYCSECDDFCCQPCKKVHNSLKWTKVTLLMDTAKIDKWRQKIISSCIYRLF